MLLPENGVALSNFNGVNKASSSRETVQSLDKLLIVCDGDFMYKPKVSENKDEKAGFIRVDSKSQKENLRGIKWMSDFFINQARAEAKGDPFIAMIVNMRHLFSALEKFTGAKRNQNRELAVKNYFKAIAQGNEEDINGDKKINYKDVIKLWKHPPEVVIQPENSETGSNGNNNNGWEHPIIMRNRLRALAS